MKKVKYVPKDSHFHPNLTLNKIYDVIEYKYINDRRLIGLITMINDIDEQKVYYINYYTGKSVFQDVTEEYRNELIDEILD